MKLVVAKYGRGACNARNGVGAGGSIVTRRWRCLKGAIQRANQGGAPAARRRDYQAAMAQYHADDSGLGGWRRR